MNLWMENSGSTPPHASAQAEETQDFLGFAELGFELAVAVTQGVGAGLTLNDPCWRTIEDFVGDTLRIDECVGHLGEGFAPEQHLPRNVETHRGEENVENKNETDHSGNLFVLKPNLISETRHRS
jgi:hypothetical protein